MPPFAVMFTKPGQDHYRTDENVHHNTQVIQSIVRTSDEAQFGT
jgi:hypothetical protein